MTLEQRAKTGVKGGCLWTSGTGGVANAGGECQALRVMDTLTDPAITGAWAETARPEVNAETSG